MNTASVHLPPTLELKIDLTDEQFCQICQHNRDLRFERTATGELIVMSPTGGTTSDRNAELTYQLRAWSRQNKLGKSFDSSGGFKLPNEANRSPNASWVRIESWQALTPEEQERFVPLCPDFVVELRSPSDALKSVQEKMQEYTDNGARLGWLIDPQRQIVEIYRPHQEVQVLRSPTVLSGEDVLPGFVLDLSEILGE